MYIKSMKVHDNFVILNIFIFLCFKNKTKIKQKLYFYISVL